MDFSTIDIPARLEDLEEADTSGFYATASVDVESATASVIANIIEAIPSLCSNDDDGIASNLTQHLIDDIYSLVKSVSLRLLGAPLSP